MSVDLWDIKYRPKSASDYIVQNQNHKELIEKWIEDKSIPHLLLSGHRGTGKTSLAYMLKNELEIDDYDFLDINASDENNVDTVRNRVKNFISGMPTSSKFKIVLLDEIDYFTAGAQAILRGMMGNEEYIETSRFILTCNYPHKVIPELHSRCKVINFGSPDKVLMTERLIKILAAEKIKIESLELVQEYVDTYYPDFRNVIINAQAGVKQGKLCHITDVVSDSTEFMVKMVDFVERDDWHTAREYLAKNITDDRLEECYRFLYDYLHEIGKFKDQKKWKQGIVTIGEYLYKHSQVADVEINFAACLIKLSEI